ncbi:hypothetical protein ACH4GM_17460 [Streptomyces coeruleorubidus]|uniref:hypothetical protein n=1 Tax=Streptomyces coeruleorubidus TaxID=116188 RepID=UPI0037B82933
MSSRRTELDPVIPRFCAQTGASLPLAWELAWSEQPDDAVVRLTPPPGPRAVDRATWPRRLSSGIRLGLASGVRLQNTPVPFLHNGGPVAVLFGQDPPAFAEVPEPVGDLLLRGTSVADVRREWEQAEEAVDHVLVGMMRFGLLSGDPSPPTRPEPEDARVLVQEAWVRAMERESGVHILAHTTTGTFLKVGAAALQLWRWAGHEDGIAFDRLPAKLHDVADRLLSAGMLRAVRP